MQLEQRIEDGVAIAKPLERRLDARSAASFKDAMADLVRSGQERIALDLSEVEFVDSSGLGAIVSTLKQLGGRGDLVICGARDTVMSMFKLTRLDRVFQMFPDQREAVAVLHS
jgi:anti-sigma B factor antagonist